MKKTAVEDALDSEPIKVRIKLARRFQARFKKHFFRIKVSKYKKKFGNKPRRPKRRRRSPKDLTLFNFWIPRSLGQTKWAGIKGGFNATWFAVKYNRFALQYKKLVGYQRYLSLFSLLLFASNRRFSLFFFRRFLLQRLFTRLRFSLNRLVLRWTKSLYRGEIRKLPSAFRQYRSPYFVVNRTVFSRFKNPLSIFVLRSVKKILFSKFFPFHTGVTMALFRSHKKHQTFLRFLPKFNRSKKWDWSQFWVLKVARSRSLWAPFSVRAHITRLFFNFKLRTVRHRLRNYIKRFAVRALRSRRYRPKDDEFFRRNHSRQIKFLRMQLGLVLFLLFIKFDAWKQSRLFVLTRRCTVKTPFFVDYLIRVFELRLPIALFRLRFFYSFYMANYFIKHFTVLVNNRLETRSLSTVKQFDVISLRKPFSFNFWLHKKFRRSGMYFAFSKANNMLVSRIRTDIPLWFEVSRLFPTAVLRVEPSFRLKILQTVYIWKFKNRGRAIRRFKKRLRALFSFDFMNTFVRLKQVRAIRWLVFPRVTTKRVCPKSFVMTRMFLRRRTHLFFDGSFRKMFRFFLRNSGLKAVIQGLLRPRLLSVTSVTLFKHACLLHRVFAATTPFFTLIIKLLLKATQFVPGFFGKKNS